MQTPQQDFVTRHGGLKDTLMLNGLVTWPSGARRESSANGHFWEESDRTPFELQTIVCLYWKKRLRVATANYALAFNEVNGWAANVQAGRTSHGPDASHLAEVEKLRAFKRLYAVKLKEETKKLETLKPEKYRQRDRDKIAIQEQASKVIEKLAKLRD